MSGKYPKFLNIALYQTLWFGCVFFQNIFVLPALALVLLHFYLCSQRLKELTVVAGCSALGIAADSGLALAGFYEFSSAVDWQPLPCWMILIWIGFAGTMRHGLLYFIERPRLAILAAAIGAPAVYHAASRLGAVQFPVGPIGTVAAVSASWIVLMLLFLWLNNKVFPNTLPAPQ